MNVHYDNWFSERSLYKEGVFDQIMTILRQGDHLFMADGAVWFNAEALGGDKNEVVIRSNGLPGYFASDISYHYNKFVQRGFDWVIDVWGADHQGHVPRMKAMMQALGLDPAAANSVPLPVGDLAGGRRAGAAVQAGRHPGGPARGAGRHWP